MGAPRLVGALFLLVALACLPAPVPPPADTSVEPNAVHAGPVIVVTVPGLRADALGAQPSVMPNLDRWAAGADWAGTAITPSSSPPAAMASLAYGFDPWHHQLSSHLAPAANPFLRSLGAGLRRAGYRTHLYRPTQGVAGVHDPFGDFDEVSESLERVEDRIARLPDERRFVWLQIAGPEPPWSAEDEPEAAGLDLADIFPYADPALPPPADLVAEARRLYRRSLAAVDARIGRILSAIAESPAADDAVIVLTAPHGLELGEEGQVLFAQNLSRATIEVPLVIDLPATWSGPGLRTGEREGDGDEGLLSPSLLRLHTTLLELTGAEIAPAHPPSLFEAGGGDPPLSSLFLTNGVNRFSGLFARDGNLYQVRIESRFAAAESEYFLAQTAQVSSRPLGMDESPRRIFQRLRRAFLEAPHWGPEVELRVVRWLPDGAVEAVDDPDLAIVLASETHGAWRRWKAEPGTPQEVRGELTRFAAP